MWRGEGFGSEQVVPSVTLVSPVSDLRLSVVLDSNRQKCLVFAGDLCPLPLRRFPSTCRAFVFSPASTSNISTSNTRTVPHSGILVDSPIFPSHTDNHIISSRTRLDFRRQSEPQNVSDYVYTTTRARGHTRRIGLGVHRSSLSSLWRWTIVMYKLSASRRSTCNPYRCLSERRRAVNRSASS